MMEALHTVTCNNVTLDIRDVKFMLHRGPHTAHFDLGRNYLFSIFCQPGPLNPVGQVGVFAGLILALDLMFDTPSIYNIFIKS